MWEQEHKIIVNTLPKYLQQAHGEEAVCESKHSNSRASAHNFFVVLNFDQVRVMSLWFKVLDGGSVCQVLN